VDTSVVTRKGQITIPARLRRRFELDVGSVVAFVEEDGQLILRIAPESIEAAFCLVQPNRPASLADIEQATENRGWAE
jgi:AbrB family looped-hinge helix DNA binding protein